MVRWWSTFGAAIPALSHRIAGQATKTDHIDHSQATTKPQDGQPQAATTKKAKNDGLGLMIELGGSVDLF